jgi:uridine monophosphate synthetase
MADTQHPPSTGFFGQLEERARRIDSLLCIGLDPEASSIAELRSECTRLIDATSDYAAAFKPNSAFFEAHGPAGIEVLREVIAHVPAGIPVLLDAKRGDIAHTSTSYARAAFGSLGAGAITLSPYIGGDGLAPFFSEPDCAAFILCKTSNPGADEFQALTVQTHAGSRKLFEVVAERAQGWSQHGNIGLVVGATDSRALSRLRELVPGMWFLVPGVGAQGGSLPEILSAGLRPDGLGLLINVSRSVARAADPGAEACRLRDEIRTLRAAAGPVRPVPTPHSAETALLAGALLESGCVRFGEFTLKSGILSPIYLDLRRLVSYPVAMQVVAQAYSGVLRGLAYKRLAGIPYAALPIATAISLTMGQPLVYPRRETKEYGTRAAVEGEFEAGETVVVIDDLATTGDTKIEAAQKLESAGLVVKDIVVLIDREQGAGDMLATAGYRLHAVARLPDLMDYWLEAGAITLEQFSHVRAFLARS